MIGAIIGDIAGSRFEWRNCKSKEFRLFHEKDHPTDDSIMSLAVAAAIMDCEGDYSELPARTVSRMQELGRKYENAGYGGTFIKWIWSKNPRPYGSYGNGSAMRVSPCGIAAGSIEEARSLSEAVTRVSHDHPEGIKGAEAIAVSVFLARSGRSRDEIRKYITDNYYDLNFTIDQIRPSYEFDVSCQGSVPVALEAFFESSDFEDAIRNAISVGGDSDTIACMAGAAAEAFYGVPDQLIRELMGYLDHRQVEILCSFEKKFPSKAITADPDAPGGQKAITVYEAVAHYLDGSDSEDADR